MSRHFSVSRHINQINFYWRLWIWFRNRNNRGGLYRSRIRLVGGGRGHVIVMWRGIPEELLLVRHMMKLVLMLNLIQKCMYLVPGMWDQEYYQAEREKRGGREKREEEERGKTYIVIWNVILVNNLMLVFQIA